MKILVPTDFSDCAYTAFKAASKIANLLDAEIILFHNISLPDSWSKVSSKKSQLNQAYDYLKDYSVQSLSQVLKSADCIGLDCQSEVEYGNFLENMNKMIQKHQVELIVMGSHGASGKNEWFIGSNAQKVVRHIETDTLIIKNPMPQKIKNAVFVTDISVRDQKAFIEFLKYVDYFKIDKIHLLCVDTESWYSQPKALIDAAFKDYKKLADGYQCETHFFRDYSIDSGVRNFTQQKEIDLIAMANHHTNPFKRFFVGSNIEMIVNHSNVSVLTIDS